ncbi:hypothetical protein [Acinetobacter sp. YH12153]|uniref:hypothetical protein n=1 Tax=Acinetobacter sp. YH12153 TaxID=2601133 RepID=UPI0015D3A79B|nr:hypothetical protein [Acinetobacter sp. YH12153]
MFNFDAQENTYSLDATTPFFEYKVEALKAIQFGLSACHLYVLKCNLNEKSSDLTVMFDKLKQLSKLTAELPKIIATESHAHFVKKPSIAILSHFEQLDDIQEQFKADSEKRAVRSSVERVLEMHNNAIQDFKIPAHTTLNTSKFAPVAMQNLSTILDCLYMYAMAVQDKVTPLVGRGLIAYTQLDFEISEEELMLDIYRQKFDFIARNLNQVVSTIEAVIRLTNYVNQENITEQDTSKMLADVSYCFVQAEMSDSANFASLLMI